MTMTQDFGAPTFEYAYFLQAPASPPSARSHGSGPAEFARAMEDYKRRHNRPFPTWSEVLEVLRGLGYAKRADLAIAGRYKVRLNRGGPAAEEIRAALDRFGAVCLPDGSFGFATAPDRDRALDAIRSDQGWTSVDPG